MQLHQHTLLAGMTGSGKTTLVKALLQRTARAIVFDPEIEYDVPDAVIVGTLQDAVREFQNLRWQPFILIFRGEEVDEFIRLLKLVMYAQETEPHGPVLVVIEESTLVSSTFKMEATVHKIMNRGRKRRVSLLLVAQLDSDIHRVAKANTRVKIAMRSDQVSSRFEGFFPLEAVQNLKSLSDPGEYTPEPIQGRHFLVYPPHLQLYHNWEETFGYIFQPVDGEIVLEDETIDIQSTDG